MKIQHETETKIKTSSKGNNANGNIKQMKEGKDNKT